MPLFKSETEKLFLADKILKTYYPPLTLPLVTPMVITQSGACPLSRRRMKPQSTVTTKRLLTSPRVTSDGSDTRRHSPVLLSGVWCWYTSDQFTVGFFTAILVHVIMLWQMNHWITNVHTYITQHDSLQKQLISKPVLKFLLFCGRFISVFMTSSHFCISWDI